MKTLSTLVFMLFFYQGMPQIKFNFTADANPSSGVPANMTVSAVSRTNGGGGMLISNASVSDYATPTASGSNNVVASAVAGGMNNGSSTYFEVTLTPAAGYKISFTAIGFGTRSTGTGPTQITVRTSIDTYTADVFTTTSPNGSWAYRQSSNFTVLGNDNTAVKIRIYGHSGTGGTSNWRLDDIWITASTISTLPFVLNNIWLSNEKSNVIKWQTTNEVNVDRFEIQGSDIDRNIRSIGSVTATNKSFNEYSFDDRSGMKFLYYRLKMIDKDGSFTYSRMVRSSNNISANIFKVTGADHLQLQGINEGIIKIYDVWGRMIQSSKIKTGRIVLTGNYQRMQYYQAILLSKEGELRTRFLYK